MGGSERPARWSPGGLLLNPEDEELTAPGTSSPRPGGTTPRVLPVAALTNCPNLVAEDNTNLSSVFRTAEDQNGSHGAGIEGSAGCVPQALGENLPLHFLASGGPCAPWLVALPPPSTLVQPVSYCMTLAPTLLPSLKDLTATPGPCWVTHLNLCPLRSAD